MTDEPEYKPGRLTADQQIAANKAKAEAGDLAKADAQAFGRAFATADGRVALRRIMEVCNYQKPITVLLGSGVDMPGTMHNAALHKHYLWLRSHVDKETLKEVEIR